MDDRTWYSGTPEPDRFRDNDAGHALLVELDAPGAQPRVQKLPVAAFAWHHWPATLGVPIELDALLAQTEPDPEIQDLLRQSEGLNLALDYLPGSIGFDPLIDKALSGKARLASSVVWFDALVTNVDRTPRNTNLLVWHGNLWLIDHGASLYFHHSWDAETLQRSRAPFAAIKDHVLLPWASEIESVDAELAAKITPESLDAILELIPEAWLVDVPRDGYREWFLRRLESPREFAQEAARARSLRV
ncbi:MAG: aminotransferase class I and II [Acidobacteriota bacterium]|nr:aminotransferase class I and II [Acidobacteriota bacterium]